MSRCARIRSAQQFELQHEILTGREIRRRFPPFSTPDDFIGLYETAAGVLDPERCVNAQRSQALSHGAAIEDGVSVLGWEPIEGGIEIRMARRAAGAGDDACAGAGEGAGTGDGGNASAIETRRARALILSPGAWMPGLLKGLDLHLAIRRMTMLWFEPPGGITPFLPDRFPIYIGETPEGPTFYGFPALGAPPVDAKIAFHDVYYQPVDLADLVRLVNSKNENPSGAASPGSENPDSPATLAEMRTFLRRYLPMLDGPLRRSATCLYTMTPDEHFILDRHPQSPRVIFASCCSGHGFKFSPAIGEALACLALDEAPPVDVSAFVFTM